MQLPLNLIQILYRAHTDLTQILHRSKPSDFQPKIWFRQYKSYRVWDCAESCSWPGLITSFIKNLLQILVRSKDLEVTNSQSLQPANYNDQLTVAHPEKVITELVLESEESSLARDEVGPARQHRALYPQSALVHHLVVSTWAPHVTHLRWEHCGNAVVTGVTVVAVVTK